MSLIHQANKIRFRSFVGRRVLITIAWMASLAFALSSPAPKFPDRRVALVTGANKGIGYEIAKKLLSHKEDNENDEGFAFCVLLGCRDETLGTAASERLASETGNSAVDVVQIDLVDEQSIRDAASYIRDTYGRCDVLINNAAVCYNDPTLYGKVPHTPFAEQAQVTIQTNFFGTQSLTRDLLPLLERSESPRLINIASSAGRLSILPSEDKRAAFSSDTLTLEELGGYLRDFVRAASDGTHAQEGWPNTGYGVSKVGIIAMTRVLAKQHAGKTMVNSVDPGYCATDQNNNQGIIPAERGAVTPYLLAILDDKEGFTGKHWYQEQEIQW